MNAIKELITLCYKALPVGTIREHTDGYKYKKISDDEWERVSDEGGKKQENIKDEKASYPNFFDKDISEEEMNVEANKYIEQNKGKLTDNPKLRVGQKIEVPYDFSENSGGYSGKIIYADKEYFTILTETGIEEENLSALNAPQGGYE